MTANVCSFIPRIVLAALLPAAAAWPQEAAEQGATTHETVATIDLRARDKGTVLHTFCLDRQGRVLAACTAGKTGDQIRVLSASGEKLASWGVPFTPQAINVGPDGQVYVGGEGQLVVFDAEGKVVRSGKLPQLGDEEALREASLEDAKASHERVLTSYRTRLESYRKTMAGLSARPAGERSDADERRLETLGRQIASLERSLEARQNIDLEAQARSMFARKLKVTAIAVSPRDVFVAAAARRGSGYELWRMDTDLGGAKCILEGLRGCCGRFDVQVRGEELVLAENTKHRVARYDRDGELLGTFGKRSRDGEEGGFGGCCNPMNTCIDDSGHIITAESEGIVRCFSADGEQLALIATAALERGCKNVALDIEPKSNRVFLIDVNNAAIVVMAPRTRGRSYEENPR